MVTAGKRQRGGWRMCVLGWKKGVGNVRWWGRREGFRGSSEMSVGVRLRWWSLEANSIVEELGEKRFEGGI